jgi:FkbM family methyltransferase
MIANVQAGNQKYLMSLTNKNDHIQKIIFNGGVYEEEMLKDIASRINKNSVFFDIGANIGNHSIYLAMIVGCKVVCFEPDRSLTKAIIESAKANNIIHLVEVHNVAVGSRDTICEIKTIDSNNIGSQQVVPDQGNIPMLPIDGLRTSVPDCIKIDVEGFEAEVLAGAAHTIQNKLPILYIEAQKESDLKQIKDFLYPMGYNIKKRFNSTPTYLFEQS